MRLTLNSKIHDLLHHHPFLLEWLVAYAPEFGKLKNPVTRATLGRIATLTMAAKIAGKDPQKLLGDVAEAIARQTGERPVLGEPEPPSPEEARARREVLKGIVRGLHEGQPADALKAQFDLLLQDVGPMEIGRMENELIREGIPAEEVRRLCDLHVEVFRPSLAQSEVPSLPPGHPVHTFMEENRAFERIAKGLAEDLGALGAMAAGPSREAQLTSIAAQLARLGAFEKHYVRKEHLIFPLLEKNGIAGPSQVMWAVHDDIRAAFKRALAAARERDGARLGDEGPKVLKAIVDMVFKEENILFPMCLELLGEADWVSIRAAEAELGYALVEPGAGWRPAAAEAPEPAPRTLARLPLDTGLLSLEQIRLLFNHLPVEVSFVDENDEVRFYSGGEDRIFPRSPQVIGRKVQNCHPPKSLDVVNRILDEFRRGARDLAEFWISFHGRFLHIRYFAMRDASRQYRGTLEVTQDVTSIRALQGERRLLDWN